MSYQTCDDLGFSCGIGCSCRSEAEKHRPLPYTPRPRMIYVKFDRRYHGRSVGPGVHQFEGYKSALEAFAAWGTSAPQWEYRITQVSEEPIPVKEPEELDNSDNLRFSGLVGDPFA